MEVKVTIQTGDMKVDLSKEIKEEQFFDIVQSVKKAIEQHQMNNVEVKPIPVKSTPTVYRPLNVNTEQEKLVFFRCDVCNYLGFGKASKFPHTFICRNCHCSHTVKENVRYVDINCSSCGKHSSYYVDTTVEGIKCKQCGKYLTEAEATTRVN